MATTMPRPATRAPHVPRDVDRQERERLARLLAERPDLLARLIDGLAEIVCDARREGRA